MTAQTQQAKIKERVRHAMLTPGTRLPFGRLTIIEPEIEDSLWGPRFYGWYIARCDCPNETIVRIHRRDIQRQNKRAWSCGEEGCDERPTKRGQKPHPLTGLQVGRLTVGDWHPGDRAAGNHGWECLCECGMIEYVARSSQLIAAGQRKCSHIS